ncbi:MAG: phosphoglycerate dehydrogenase [Planctomycetes bacterium]|nr:phosphoglycerate dehydrogenase [Planctomycetota bacterium]
MSLPMCIVTEALDDAAIDWLAGHARIVRGSPASAEFAAAASEAQALVVRTYTIVDDALLDRLPALRVVARAGVGLDNIDVAACRRRGVEVVHTPDANTQAVVEYVLCLLCDALRPRLFLDRPLAKDAWDDVREEVVGAWQMDELVLGILGMGRIGQRVAQVAGAIGFHCIYHDLLEIPESARHGAQPCGIEQLFADSDVVTVHVDGRASNRGLVGAPLLERLRDDAVLINTSRGFVIDDRALAAWLGTRPGAQVILDVHDPEPFTHGHPLLGMANAHLAPHLASRTLTAMANMSWVVKDVAAVLGGAPPRFPAPLR